MDTDFDFSRLEGNLSEELLAVFDTTRVNTEEIAPTWQPLRVPQVAFTLEGLAIEWLSGRDDRTVEVFEEHIWPTFCEMAVLDPNADDNYEEHEYWFREVLGLTDNEDREPETTFLLRGLLSCAMSLAASDFETALNRAFFAQYCYGLTNGAAQHRLESEGGSSAALSALGKIGAHARHRENRALKADALRHYAEHRQSFKSKDAAAAAIAQKIVPASFRTVREWLKEAPPK